MKTEGKTKMTKRRRIGAVALAAVLVAAGLMSGRSLISDLSGFVSTAQAYVNRPVTPVKVTQVAQTGLWGGCNYAMMTTC